MSGGIWGIPFKIAEVVMLEVGDVLPDGQGSVWRVLEVGVDPGGMVLAHNDRLNRDEKLPRLIDLRHEAPGYILRPQSGSPWPSARDTVIGGDIFVERVRSGEVDEAVRRSEAIRRMESRTGPDDWIKGTTTDNR